MIQGAAERSKINIHVWRHEWHSPVYEDRKQAYSKVRIKMDLTEE